MSESRTNGGRPRSRAFRPSLDGRLEERVLMSSAASKVKDQLSLAGDLLRHPAARNGYLLKHPPQLALNSPPIQGKVRKRAGVAATETLKGGEDVLVNSGGSHYQIALSYTSNTLATNVAEGANGQSGDSSSSTAGAVGGATALVSQAGANFPQPIGTVRAYAMPGHRVGLIVDGSTQNTELTINPLGQQQRKGFATSFAYGAAARGHILNIGQITVNTGEIGDIEGFQDADLSGPLVASGTTSIDRIAFDAILPGASITTGGDVQTLDVVNGISLSGTSINIGRDLNLLNVGGNIDLTNGAQFNIGRNLGLVSQPPKGTGTGTNVLTLNFTDVANSIINVTIPAVGSFIQGNVDVDPTSAFNIGGNIFNTMYVAGSVTAGFVPATPAPLPTPTPTPTPTATTVGSLTRLTVDDGKPAPLLQSALSQFNDTSDTTYVTALGGFA
jgi:hypothetical protein